MHRLHITLFALIILLGQWGGIDHAYHEHDTGEVCDFCLSAQALDNAITPALQFVFTPSFHQFQPELVLGYVSKNNARYYAARAPPPFI